MIETLVVDSIKAICINITMYQNIDIINNKAFLSGGPTFKSLYLQVPENILITNNYKHSPISGKCLFFLHLYNRFFARTKPIPFCL